MGYLRTNITSINQLLNKRETIPFNQKQYKYWFVIQLFYEQQQYMYSINTLSVDHRKVSTHQPHVRPIVRVKSPVKVEFGAKINVSKVDYFSFIDDFS